MTKNVSEVNGEWTVSFRDEQQKLDNETDAEEMAKAIENAECIEVLELRGNTIGVGAGQRLAQALERHSELKRALWSDLFTGRLKQEIPPILRSLCDAMIRSGTRLVELDLSDNAFGPIGAEGIEKFLESPSAYSLEVLKLNNNGLGAGGKTIAKALQRCLENARRDGQNFQLKTFIAGRNRLEDPGAFALAQAFQALGSLEEITMYQDGIKPRGIEALAKSLRHNPNLKIVNFNDNTFTVSGARAMAQAVRDLKKLEVLNFGDCLCRDKGASAIIASLSSSDHSHLKEINLSGNELSPQTIEVILSRVTKSFQLQSLVLHTNNLGGQFDEVKTRFENFDFVDFGEESDDQGSLDGEDGGENDDHAELYSDESHSGDEGNESDDEQTENVIDTDHDVTIDHSLKADGSEFAISFTNQRWNNAADAETVIQELLSKKQVKILDLHDNHIGVGACRKIAEILRLRIEQKHFRSLEEVNLSRNGLAVEGFKDLASTFRSNPDLRVINLSGNTLKSEGALALAKMLPALRLLEVLDLSGCACRDSGIFAVVASLSSSTHLRLKSLDFSSNGLGASAVQKITRVFATGGFHLEHLSLHSNNIGHRFAELKEALSHIQFLDLGSDSSDRGSVEEEIGDMRRTERESGNEGDDEHTEDPDQDISLVKEPTHLTMDDVILFTRKPTLAVLDALVSHSRTLTEILHGDLHGRTQEVTAALFFSFCTLLSAESPNKRATGQKIVALTNAILKAAEKVERRPVSATESLCNQLLAFAGAVRLESHSPATADISSVIFILESMLQRGHFQELLPTIKFSFNAIKQTCSNRSAEIDRFLQTLETAYKG